MTAPQPVTLGSDSVRAQILRALDPVEVALSGTHYVADVLVPLVDRLRAAAKAEAWEEGHTVGWDDCAAVTEGGPDDETPNPYRTNPSSEETHRGA